MRQVIASCPAHSGVNAELENIKRNVDDQWTAINDLRKTSDRLMQKLNVVLAALVVSSVMLTVNAIMISIK